MELVALHDNGLFKIVFDFPTPRPHFIILFKEAQKKSIRNLSDAEFQKLFELIDSFRSKYASLNNEDMTLSFHTGYWANTEVFHAHLCVNEAIYLNVFNQVNPNLNSVTPTRQWKINISGKSKKDLYVLNVENYKVINTESSNRYRLKEIDSCRRLPSNLASSNGSIDSLGEARVVYDMNEPKLRFIMNTASDADRILTKTKLMKIMCQFADEKGYFKKNNGCHICLTLEKSASETTVNGYLHTAGDEFYKIHPQPQEFLTNFSNLNRYYIST